MKSYFYDTYGTYTFASPDELPPSEDVTAFLLEMAQTAAGMESLRDVLARFGHERGTPVGKLSRDQVMQRVARLISDGAILSWESAPIAPPAVAKHEHVEAEPEPPPPETKAAPTETNTQAETLVGASEDGAPFCEI